MIAQLRGTLADKRPNQVLVDVGGVGYLVFIPLSTFYALGELHAEVTLLTYTHVREDALALYGFLTAHEKHLFELLISASGVGPSLALKILSGMSVDDLVPGRSYYYRLVAASEASTIWCRRFARATWFA